MKRKPFLLLLLSTIFSSMMAQELYSRPFAEDHKLWVSIYNNYKVEYFTDGDTVIAGIKCFRLFQQEKADDALISQSYYGAIFDKGKKSYFISPNKEEPQLLLDFGLSEGDHFMMMDMEMWVEKDTVVQSCDRYYRRLLIHNLTNEQKNSEYGEDFYVPGYWIEGIGSTSARYFYNTYSWSSTLWYRLAVCYVNGELIYRDPRYTQETDGIEVPKASSRNSDSAVYDLQGRMLQSNKVTKSQGATATKGDAFVTQWRKNLPKGVYIVNGKKVMLRK